ncbi:MAG: DUF6868 family protein [Iodobacter sp.]
MTSEKLSEFLFFCLCINYGVLLLWFSAFALDRQRLFRLHRRWFQLSEPHFDTIHYAAMALYKITIMIFNLAPWLALHFVSF